MKFQRIIGSVLIGSGTLLIYTGAKLIIKGVRIWRKSSGLLGKELKKLGRR